MQRRKKEFGREKIGGVNIKKEDELKKDDEEKKEEEQDENKQKKCSIQNVSPRFCSLLHFLIFSFRNSTLMRARGGEGGEGWGSGREAGWEGGGMDNSAWK
jgi:hypothetical protein